MNERFPRQAGLSLIETLVALLILMFVSLTIIGLFTHATQLNASGQDYTALTNAARDQLERLLDLPYDHLDLAAGGPTTSQQTPANSMSEFELTTTITEHMINQGTQDVATALATPSAGAGNLKRITVRVASERAGILGQREVTLQALKQLGG